MTTPLFTIITCTYNAESTLERTIRSVDSQTYPGIEHLILDGKSTDRTLEIAARSERARIISEPDKGLYDAMNNGISLATGDYLIFLNAGDCFHSNDTLSQVASILEGKNPDVIYGETALVDGDGKFLRMRRLKAPENLNWKSFKEGMLVCHQAFWARTEIARKTQYDLQYRFSADVDWCIRIMKESRVLFNTRTTLIDYLSEGMTTNNRWASLKERFAIMRKYYGLPSTVTKHLCFMVRAVIVK